MAVAAAAPLILASVLSLRKDMPGDLYFQVPTRSSTVNLVVAVALATVWPILLIICPNFSLLKKSLKSVACADRAPIAMIAPMRMVHRCLIIVFNLWMIFL